MAWGIKQSATARNNVTTELYFDETPILEDEGLAHCQVSVKFLPNPGDDAIVRVYATLDDGPMDTAEWDTQLFGEHVIDKINVGLATISFTVSGVYRFRIGVQSARTLESVTFSYRLARQPAGASNSPQSGKRSASPKRSAR